MIREFQYYIDEGLVKKQSPNLEEARSLMRKAMKRFEYIKNQEITEQAASFIFEDVYEAFREAAQALMSLKGFKPYSHEALISFLRKFHNFSEHDLSSFDRYRILRNKTVYSAVGISAGTCRQAFAFLERFLPELKLEYDKETK